MKVRITFDLSYSARVGINHWYGHEGPASYETCRGWILDTIDGELMEVELEAGVEEMLSGRRRGEGAGEEGRCWN